MYGWFTTNKASKRTAEPSGAPSAGEAQHAHARPARPLWLAAVKGTAGLAVLLFVVQHSCGGVGSLIAEIGGLGVQLKSFRSSSVLKAPQLEVLLPELHLMLPGETLYDDICKLASCQQSALASRA